MRVLNEKVKFGGRMLKRLSFKEIPGTKFAASWIPGDTDLMKEVKESYASEKVSNTETRIKGIKRISARFMDS